MQNIVETGIGVQFLGEAEESDPLHTFGVPVGVRIKAGSGMSQADRSSPQHRQGPCISFSSSLWAP